VRKLRIFIVELILVGMLVAWIFEKFPETVDRFIPWICLAILWHLSWEIILENRYVKEHLARTLKLERRMTWLCAFAVGGCISLLYLRGINEALGSLAAGHTKNVATDKKKPTESLPTISPVSSSLELIATAGSAQYPAGTKIAGILWSLRFVDLRVTILNPSTSDYADVDLTLRPDEPVAEIAQVTNVPDVSFLAGTDLTMRQEFQEGATGKRIVNPLTLILSSGGYRLRCKSLPRKGRLEILLAIARGRDFPTRQKSPKPSYGGIFETDYVLKVHASDGIDHWFGHGSRAGKRIESVFKEGLYIPKTVRVEGIYNVGSEQRAVSQVLDVKDIIGDSLRQIRRNR